MAAKEYGKNEFLLKVKKLDSSKQFKTNNLNKIKGLPPLEHHLSSLQALPHQPACQGRLSNKTQKILCRSTKMRPNSGSQEKNDSRRGSGPPVAEVNQLQQQKPKPGEGDKRSGGLIRPYPATDHPSFK